MSIRKISPLKPSPWVETKLSMVAGTIQLSDIEKARDRISQSIRLTPAVQSASLGEPSNVPVYLKLEHHQVTGSFKVRGATNAVLNLSKQQHKGGIVGFSTGNHGRGLAFAAHQAGINCVICMSSLVPKNKVDEIKALGADVRIIGKSQDEAEIEVDRLVKEQSMTLLPPFDHFDIICGQGTIGLELLEQVPDLETILVPVSGGGLACGIAIAVKALRANVKVIGISMERGAAMYESIQAGQPTMVEELPSLADSLGGGVGQDNQYTFHLFQEWIDDFVLVSEQEIAEAIRHAYWSERQIIEGSGSVGIAALLSGKLQPKGQTVVISSGGNIDMKLHHRIISGENINLLEE